MDKATKTAETASATIKITLHRGVYDDTVYADGWNLPAGRKTYEIYDVVLTPTAGGKEVITHGKPGDFAFLSKPGQGKGVPAGAVARLGDAYIGKTTYDAIMGLIAALDAELPKSAEQVALEQAAAVAEAKRKTLAEENERRMDAEREERESHPGWCKRCEDYTYGDCGHRN
jgi:hypothetical protein